MRFFIRRSGGPAVVVAAAVWTMSSAAPAQRDVSGLLARGIELGYNLDHQEAAAAFREAVAADPSSVAAHRLAAAAAWMAILFEQGAITIEDYLGEARSSAPRPSPNPALAAAFRTHVDRAIALAAQRLRERPDDADAHYQAGAAHALLASYIATVEGRVSGSFGPARRAYREQERALALDPGRKDAGLITGTYRYTISSLSLPARLFARLAGFGSGRERGIALVEAAAAHPSDAQPGARFMLVLLYNRERRYDDALRVITGLRESFPRNRLLWLEAGSTALRAGRPTAAAAAIEQGFLHLGRDQRPRAGGEISRWHLAYGSALRECGRGADAERQLQAALPAATRPWVRGRARLQLGLLRETSGDAAAALAELSAAASLCQADDDPECVKEARASMRRVRK
jgi:tetratricopeptide (TPR) repeat protein